MPMYVLESVLAIVAGILVLAVPKFLNYFVAIYLIEPGSCVWCVSRAHGGSGSRALWRTSCRAKKGGRTWESWLQLASC